MIDVEKLRRDYMAVAGWLVDCGEWTGAESHEVGQAIKTALDQQESGYLAYWAEWMAYWAGLARAHAERMTYLNQAASAWAREQGRKAA